MCGAWSGPLRAAVPATEPSHGPAGVPSAEPSPECSRNEPLAVGSSYMMSFYSPVTFQVTCGVSFHAPVVLCNTR